MTKLLYTEVIEHEVELELAPAEELLNEYRRLVRARARTLGGGLRKDLSEEYDLIRTEILRRLKK